LDKKKRINQKKLLLEIEKEKNLNSIGWIEEKLK